MTSKLIRVASYEAENQFEFLLRQAFKLLEPKLRPPFSLNIPNSLEYLELNRAIVYGVLCEPLFSKIHIKHLHAIVTDGYGLIVHLLQTVVNDLYVNLFDSAKNQIIWVTGEMIDVSAVGVDGLLISLLRQIVGGDFSEGNLWLCLKLVNLFLDKWNYLLEELPLVVPSALYTFLRLLADHCRLSGAKIEPLKQLEIEFCVKVIKEQFCFCLKIGRDFIRLLQDLVHVAEFRAIWKELLINPSYFKTPGFMDISQFYYTRTSSRYSLLRISPEMEAQLRFLMTNVKLGCQKRYQVWFAKRFLHGPERETVICDIVRFICCAHHPPDKVIQSDIIPRWAVIGWLLKSCKKHYVEANAKLALFYDWLFFDDRTENIMNIEPAVLLMVYSIPKYTDMTHTLLEFLFLLVDNYDVERRDKIFWGVSSAFTALTEKGVIPSLDTLISFDGLSPFLRDRLRILSLGRKVQPTEELQFCVPDGAMMPNCLPSKSCAGTVVRSPESQSSFILAERSAKSVATAIPIVSGLSDSHHSVATDVDKCDDIESLIKSLGEMVKKSNEMGLKPLEELVFSFLSLDHNELSSGSMCTDALFSKIINAYELSGYKLFASLDLHLDNHNYDDEIGSASALLIRTYIFNQAKKMKEMLLFCSRNGLPVGARLLSYVSRLAFEAKQEKFVRHADNENNGVTEIDSPTPLLLFHLNGYVSSRSGMTENSQETAPSLSKIDKNLVADSVRNAFSAYRYFLACRKDILFGDAEESLTKVFYLDLMSCVKWNTGRLKFLFCCIFDHLSDLCICQEEIVKLLVTRFDYTDLVDMQFEIIQKKFSMFGENAESIFLLIKNSLKWDCLEQHKLWGLLRSELMVSKFQVENIVLTILGSCILDSSLHAIAVEGVLNLCCRCAPSVELVGAVMSLPDDALQGFSAAVLAAWVVSNESMLFHSLAIFSENVSKVSENKMKMMVNHSAILWLVNYFVAQGIDNSAIFGNLYGNLLGGKEKS